MIGYETGVQEAAKSTPSLTVSIQWPSYERPGYQFAKRAFDIVFSSLSLLLLFPVFLFVSAGIAISDGFPTAFRQKRIGKNGDLFLIMKFRTMVKNAEEVLRARPELLAEYQQTYKIHNDPRIFKFGNFLRKSSLDEFPQLFNVLKGEMSIVGPRPIVEPEIAMYGDQAEMYKQMKPGCAGLWQCCGRSATTYEERVELDREYYENATLWFDLVILGRTIVAIVTGRGAQ